MVNSGTKMIIVRRKTPPNDAKHMRQGKFTTSSVTCKEEKGDCDGAMSGNNE